MTVIERLKWLYDRLKRDSLPRRLLDIFSFENAACITCDNANFDTISQAMLMERLIHITYRDGRKGSITQRQMEPYRLHNYDGGWYLIGFCHLRRKPRNFQLNRILDVTISDKGFKTRRFDVDDYINGPFGIFKGSPTEQAVLRFRPPAARLVREQCWHPAQKIHENKDGTLTLPVAELTEIHMKALQYGNLVEVLAPPELRRELAAEIRAMGDIYREAMGTFMISCFSFRR